MWSWPEDLEKKASLEDKTETAQGNGEASEEGEASTGAALEPASVSALEAQEDESTKQDAFPSDDQASMGYEQSGSTSVSAYSSALPAASDDDAAGHELDDLDDVETDEGGAIQDDESDTSGESFCQEDTAAILTDEFESGDDDDQQRRRIEIEMQSDSDSHDDEAHDKVGPMGEDDIELGLVPQQAHQSGGGSSSELPGSAPRRLSSLRSSSVTDLSTGKKGGARAHLARLRSKSSGTPSSPGQRFRHALFGKLTSPTIPNKRQAEDQQPRRPGIDETKKSMHGRLMVSTRTLPVLSPNLENHRSSAPSTYTRANTAQYRLQAVTPPSRMTRFLSWFGVQEGALGIYDDVNRSSRPGCCWCCGANPNLFVVRYLHWTFRSSFAAVFLSAAVGWFFLITMFAIGIWAIGVRKPTCIGGSDFKPEYFIDAWELSWTTLSTVGYGIVYSGISPNEPNIHICTGMTILVSAEAFIGILFASVCGAIMVAKVSRIQSYAQLIFCDPLLIRFGQGVLHHDDGASEGDAEADVSTASGDELEQIPCPVLEFRLVNRLSGTPGGEIIDASINIVASIDASQACPTLRRATSRRRRKNKKGGRRSRGGSGPVQRKNANPLGNSAHEMRREDSSDSLASLADDKSACQRSQTHQAFDEDHTGHLVARRIFSRLEVDTPDHPFFKRSWTLRHTLDENSPLLKANARQLVKRNAGYWPPELNNHEGVRASVFFEQILVSISGTSNADANTVYAQKIYDFADINVGYRFVNLLYRDEHDGSLQIDSRLINDVTEQAGGGGEPFMSRRRIEMNRNDMDIL